MGRPLDLQLQMLSRKGTAFPSKPSVLLRHISYCFLLLYRELSARRYPLYWRAEKAHKWPFPLTSLPWINSVYTKDLTLLRVLSAFQHLFRLAFYQTDQRRRKLGHADDYS